MESIERSLEESLLPAAGEGGKDDARDDEEGGTLIDGDGADPPPEPKGCLARLLGAALFFLPKVEPLPWGTFAALTLWSAVPPLCFILAFTQMGFGENIYYKVAAKLGENQNVYLLALILADLIFTLYMLDAEGWTSRCGSIFFDLCILVIVCGFVLLILLIADDFPYGMICIYALFYPLWLLALKLLFYDTKETRTFVSWLGGPLFFVSVIILVAWTAWVFSDPDNGWNHVARAVAAARTGCVPDYEEHPDCRESPGSDETCFHVDKHDGKDEFVFPEGCDRTCPGVYDGCPNGFILWIGPVLLGMTSFFLSFFCTFLRTEGAREKDALNFGVVWMFLLFTFWITTSLAGTAAGVIATLATLTLASFVASAMFIAVSFSKEERSRNAAAVFERLERKYGKYLDVARALFVVTCAPIVLVYLGFSMVNQLIRQIGIFPCSQPPGDRGDILTTRTRKQVAVIQSWDRAKVYTFAVYWGIGYMTLSVIVSQLTTVLLSLIIEKTAVFGLPAVTAIMCGVGAAMFLLPPVPGVPVYLTLGIVLPAQGHKTLGYPGSIAYSTIVGLVLKLFSSALQQKGIGQNLSHYVKVRQFVGINSKFMKAMRLVLQKGGLSVPKVAILIGGPDWPTSVLCGIMKLSLPQIMIGTSPIIFLIFPTCLSGALLYMASVETDTGNPEFPWAGAISAITLSVTVLVQSASMVVAAYYLEQTARNRAADVEAIADDIEVKEADEKAAHLKSCYQEVTQWNVLPLTAKLVLLVSLGSIITSSYVVTLFPDKCFAPYTLTDTIGANLEGNVANLFLPLGWVAVALFCISSILVYLFLSWGKRKARKLANRPVAACESPLEASSATNKPYNK